MTGEGVRRESRNWRPLVVVTAVVLAAQTVALVWLAVAYRDVRADLRSQQRLAASLMRSIGFASAERISAPRGCEGRPAIWSDAPEAQGLACRRRAR